MTDRRVWFFVVAAILALVVLPLTPGDSRWVAWAVVGVYVVFALLFALNSFVANHPGASDEGGS